MGIGKRTFARVAAKATCRYQRQKNNYNYQTHNNNDDDNNAAAYAWLIFQLIKWVAFGIFSIFMIEKCGIIIGGGISFWVYLFILAFL